MLIKAKDKYGIFPEKNAEFVYFVVNLLLICVKMLSLGVGRHILYEELKMDVKNNIHDV